MHTDSLGRVCGHSPAGLSVGGGVSSVRVIHGASVVHGCASRIACVGYPDGVARVSLHALPGAANTAHVRGFPAPRGSFFND